MNQNAYGNTFFAKRYLWAQTLLYMKLTALLLFVACLHVSARTYSQKVSLSGKNISLEQVFEMVKAQTGYDAIYNPDLLRKTKPITIDVKNADLTEVLQYCFRDQPVSFLIRYNTIVVTTRLEEKKALPPGTVNSEQDIPVLEINGKVLSETGEPLSGVSIVVKGTAKGTTTGADGSFIIDANPGDVLVVSFVGHIPQEITVTQSKSLSIKLKQAVNEMDQVVVVGYGTQKKKDLTGAVSTIDNKAIKSTKSMNLVTDLQGKVPGLQIRQQSDEPGGFMSMVNIRGFGTPLIVIDGVIRDGISDFARLNPENIENISVLKDASAAVYGMNSGNGVIIVTTKSGHTGKTQFSYSTHFGMKKPTGLRDKTSAYTYLLIKNEENRNSGLSPAYSEEVLEKWKAGTDPGYQEIDWYGLTLHKFTTEQQHNLSVTGGDDKANYYANFGYQQDNGLLKSNMEHYRKYDFFTALNAKLTKELKVSIKVGGRVDENNAPQNTFFWLFKPILIADQKVGPTVIGDSTRMSYVPPEGTNPYAEGNEGISGYERYQNLQYQSSVELTYTAPWLKGFSVNLLGAFDGNVRISSNLNKGYPLYDYKTGALVSPAPKTTYRESMNKFSRADIQTNLSYKNTFAGKHNVSATLISEMRSLTGNNLNAQRQYDQLYTHDVIDQGSLTNSQNGGNRSTEHYLSYMGRVNYSYENKYIFQFISRLDGSYRYAPENRWASFPAVSAGWRVSEESFFRNNISFISDLKLRFSYGINGQDAGLPFQYLGGYQLSDISGGYVFDDGILTNGLIAPGVVNSNLSWVKTRLADIGIDAEIWGGKLGLSADVFQKTEDGLLATRAESITNTFGASFPQENLNKDLVRGIEFSVRNQGRIGSVKYSVNANVTYSRKKYIHTERAPYSSSMQRWRNIYADGRYEGVAFGYLTDGVYTSLDQYQTAPLMGLSLGNSKNLPGSSRIVDANGDGTINADDMVPIYWSGQIGGAYANNPPLQYGLSLQLNWKRFDFNVVMQGAALYSIFTSPVDLWGYITNPMMWTQYMDRWHTADPAADPFDPNTEWVAGYWPALKTDLTGTPDPLITEKWMLNAAYLRIKSMQLGYSLPSTWMNAIRFNEVQVFANCYNLFTISNKYLKGLDPEREEGAYSADLRYPLMKSFNMGISIKF